MGKYRALFVILAVLNFAQKVSSSLLDCNALTECIPCDENLECRCNATSFDKIFLPCIVKNGVGYLWVYDEKGNLTSCSKKNNTMTTCSSSGTCKITTTVKLGAMVNNIESCFMKEKSNKEGKSLEQGGPANVECNNISAVTDTLKKVMEQISNINLDQKFMNISLEIAGFKNTCPIITDEHLPQSQSLPRTVHAGMLKPSVHNNVNVCAPEINETIQKSQSTLMWVMCGVGLTQILVLVLLAFYTDLRKQCKKVVHAYEVDPTSSIPLEPMIVAAQESASQSQNDVVVDNDLYAVIGKC